MRSRKVYALLILVVASCSSDLDREGAAGKVREHMLAAGPHNEWIVDMDVVVEEILQPNESLRTVRFRVVLPTDTSDVLQIHLTRSDAGWAITGYGPNAISYVATVVWSSRWGLYGDLLPSLSHLRASASDWRIHKEDPPANESTWAMLARFERDTYHWQHAPPRAELATLVKADSLPANSVEWGVFPDEDAVLIWVRDSSDSTRICVEPFNPEYSYILSDEFDWVDEDKSTQCIGDTEPFWSLMRESLITEIMANGGIWLN